MVFTSFNLRISNVNIILKLEINDDFYRKFIDNVEEILSINELDYLSLEKIKKETAN